MIDINNLCWINLSRIPNAINLLEKYPDQIDWDSLSSNPNAIYLLEKNQDKIDWINLSKDSYIFEKTLCYLQRRINKSSIKSIRNSKTFGYKSFISL